MVKNYVVFCPIKQHSFEPFMCLHLVLECQQSFLFQIFMKFLIFIYFFKVVCFESDCVVCFSESNTQCTFCFLTLSAIPHTHISICSVCNVIIYSMHNLCNRQEKVLILLLHQYFFTVAISLIAFVSQCYSLYIIHSIGIHLK